MLSILCIERLESEMTGDYGFPHIKIWSWKGWGVVDRHILKYGLGDDRRIKKLKKPLDIKIQSWRY